MGGLVRRVIGWVCLVLAVLLLVLFVLGTWNPGDLVVLWRYGRNPLLGAVLVFGLGFVASWLVTPVNNEAVQTGRARVRITLGLLLLFSLIAYGLFGNQFIPDYRIVATSPDGEHRIVMYDPDSNLQRLHVWTGTGLGQKYAGEIGYPCGPTVVRFDTPDSVMISTSYADRRITLDPVTGRPQSTLGPSCSD